MIESNNPELNVDELMQKIREEVVQRKNHTQLFQRSLLLNSSSNEVKINFNFSYLEALLRNAESRADARTKWPEKLNRFPFTLSEKIKEYCLKIVNFIFKDQREVNFNLVNALKQSTLLNRQLVVEIEVLRSQFNEHLGSFESRINQADSPVKVLDERINQVDSQVNVLDERFNQVDNQVKILDERINQVDNQVNVLDERFNQVDNQVNVLDERFNQVDNQVKILDERINQVDNQVKVSDEHFNQLDNQVKVSDEHLNQLNNQVKVSDEGFNQLDSQVKVLDERLNYINSRVQELNGNYLQNDNYIKNDLAQQKRLITIFLEEAHKRLPEPFNQEQLQTFVNEDKHLSDAFYVAFEDKFRGSREDIFNRLKVYLPLIEEAKLGTSELPILDVGCGRGEWLELLRESGYTARGLDINRAMIEQCLNRGFEVIESDVISYLQSLKNDSLGAITGFHIIEHLSFETLMTLFNETIRVIRPGGLVIFETPNPENIIVGSCNFYSDPSHKKPLFPPTIKFICEQYGFKDVQLLRLHQLRIEDNLEFIEADHALASRLNPIIEIIKSRFYVAPDFAVIAKKA